MSFPPSFPSRIPLLPRPMGHQPAGPSFNFETLIIKLSKVSIFQSKNLAFFPKRHNLPCFNQCQWCVRRWWIWMHEMLWVYITWLGALLNLGSPCRAHNSACQSPFNNNTSTRFKGGSSCNNCFRWKYFWKMSRWSRQKDITGVWSCQQLVKYL